MIFLRKLIPRPVEPFYFLLLIFVFLSCSKSGIIEGGSYIGNTDGQIHTFYLYDFVSEQEIYEHALKLGQLPDSQVLIYYFSHNSNIPSQSISLSKDLKDATIVIKKYAFNIKYAFECNREGRIRFIDCMVSPGDELCRQIN